MAENMDKEAKKAALEAEKAAKKAKKERIKASKPKKEGNIFTRMWAAIKKFFKDFRGLTKKIIWPDAKTVFKSSGIVLVVIIIVGAGVYGIDQLLNVVFKQASNLSISAGEYFAEDVVTELVTDENGETVTDENGEAVTIVVTTEATEAATEAATDAAAGETTDAAVEATDAEASEAAEEAATIPEESVAAETATTEPAA